MKRPPNKLKMLLAAAIACTGWALTSPSAAAPSDAYPGDRPISLIVPYPAGGPSDASARIFSEQVAEFLEKNVVVENIGGATGTIAARRMLAASADGYMFFHGSPSELILPSLVNRAVSYVPEDFELVQAITSATIVVIMRSDLKVENLDELIRKAQSSEKPITYGTVGNGSLYHLITERLKKDTGANMDHIPYRGSAPALMDVAGGQVDLAVLPFQTSMLGLQNEGRIKILSTLGTQVPEPLKNIPNVRDSKLLKDFDYSVIAGYFVKKGTPLQAKQALNAAVGYALNKEDVRQKLELEGRIVYRPGSMEESEALWQDNIDSLRRLVDTVGFEPL